MRNRTFSVKLDAISVGNFDFPTEDQKRRAIEAGCTHIYKSADLSGSLSRLPKYITNAVAGEYNLVIVGSSTYHYTLVGFVPTQK